MSDQSITLPQVATIEFVCPCHQWNPNKCNQPPLAIVFETKNFEEGGVEAMRNQRSRFMKEIMDLYDNKAEELRQKLNELDPGTARPPLARHGMMLVDAALTADANETTEEAHV